MFNDCTGEKMMHVKRQFEMVPADCRLLRRALQHKRVLMERTRT